MGSPSSGRIPRAPPYSGIYILPTRTGLSPSPVCLSRQFRFLYVYPSAGPISLATTFGVSVDFLSCRYLDVSVPCVRLQVLRCFSSLRSPLYPIYSDKDTDCSVGSPIRISADQCLFTAPRSFSQCITSFIASECQGIHQMPFHA